MNKSAFKSVDEYLVSQPDVPQRTLERVRTAIRKALPEAEEMISYNIPTYRLPGGPVLYFAGWKQHYSLYPVSAGLLTAFKDELASYEVDKGTIRFPLSQPAPVKLIGQIAEFRAKEVAERSKVKATKKKTRGLIDP